MNTEEDPFMKRALELATKGRLEVAPNPMVGAVIVHQGKIIGEGYHRKYGEAHAEVNAINNVEDQSLLSESSIYLNLEPCNHHGKTPPCADLLIEKKIARVVIANCDPSEKVDGKGIDKLKAAGIEVKTGVCEAEGRELNRRFFCLHEKSRPYITLKWALTADGFMGRDENDPQKEDRWITSPLSRQWVHQMRAEEMGILIGSQTAIADDPQLNCREVKGRDPIRFLVDPDLEVDEKARLFKNKGMTVVFNRSKTGSDKYCQWVLYEDFFSDLFEYCQKENIHSLLIEGGSYTLAKFIAAGHWDQAMIFRGVKKFGKGIAGPQLEGELLASGNSGTDLWFKYQNRKA